MIKELKSFLLSPPPGLKLHVDRKNVRSWIIDITGPSKSIYEGESFKLKMEFPSDYPSKPPVVFFLKPVPRHIHVYSNGDICLNLLGRDWNPCLTGEALALSIVSMLSSAKEKSYPPDNSNHAANQPGRQADNWMYHDDHC